MESSALVEKVAEELNILEAIYADDKVVAEPAQISVKHPETVECQFRFTPNTGFDDAKISVVVLAKFQFSPQVGMQADFTYHFSIHLKHLNLSLNRSKVWMMTRQKMFLKLLRKSKLYHIIVKGWKFFHVKGRRMKMIMGWSLMHMRKSERYSHGTIIN